MRYLYVASMIVSLVVSIQVETAQAEHPFRGSARWSVLVCNYSDTTAWYSTHNRTARSLADLRDMLIQPGTGGVADFYKDVTRGAVTMEQSVVRGWFTIPRTVNDALGLSRTDSFQLCVDAARTGGYTPPADHSVAVVTSPPVDLWGGGGGRAFLSVDHEPAAYEHELSHGLGLEHSHSDNVTQACGGQGSEYHDSWDVMSWNCGTLGTMTARFGMGGPAFNAFHLDRMGWLGRSEVLVFGADGSTSATVTLAPLYRHGFGGTRLVRIPYDPADLNRYYTIELRMRTGWDAGFEAPIVLIHESRSLPSGQYRSFLQRESLNGLPSQTLSVNGVNIRILNIDTTTGTAQVAITSDLPQRCLMGFVWREAGMNDRVCVIGQVRESTRQENLLAPSRRSPNGGPFGIETCRIGFVWREAFPNDKVCVTGAVRDRVREENRTAGKRNNPARIAFGPNTCRPGFVWREADDRDWVCVTPATRSETRQENTLAPTRRVGLKNTCKQGFVWREAYPVDDKTCVLGSSRTRARADNAVADSRRQPF